MNKLVVGKNAFVFSCGFLLVVSFGCLLNGMFFAENASETWHALLICVSAAVVLVYLLMVKPSPANYVIAVGLVIRVGWLLLHGEAFFVSDLVKDFFYFGDGYHDSAMKLWGNEAITATRPILTLNSYSLYPKILSAMYHLFGASHLLAGWFNVGMFLLAAFFTKKIARLLGISKCGIAVCVLPFSLMPYAILFTTGTFRENIMVAPLVMSLYFMLVWMQGARWLNVVGAFACVLFVCYIHAGYFPALGVYALLAAFYDRGQAKLRITAWPLLLLGVGALVIVFLPAELRSVFFGKVGALWTTDVPTIVSDNLSSWRGGSAYLGGVQVNGSLTLLWYAPLKFLYFFVSPVPFDWRGLQDAATFWTDSVFWILLGCCGLWGIKSRRTRTIEWWILLLLIAGIGAVFAMGTFTAGTALRHRLTLLPFVSVFGVYVISNYRKLATGSE